MFCIAFQEEYGGKDSPQEADFVSTSFTLRVSLRILPSVLSTRWARSSMISEKQRQREEKRTRQNAVFSCCSSQTERNYSVVFVFMGLNKRSATLFYTYIYIIIWKQMSFDGLDTRAVNSFEGKELLVHRPERWWGFWRRFGGGGWKLCESTLHTFKRFHYFLNPFWI